MHEEYGGQHGGGASRPTRLPSPGARRRVQPWSGCSGLSLPYARVDLMRLDDGVLALSEIEVVEPGLYLEVVPGNASAFAEMVAGLLAARR